MTYSPKTLHVKKMHQVSKYIEFSLLVKQNITIFVVQNFGTLPCLWYFNGQKNRDFRGWLHCGISGNQEVRNNYIV